MKAHFMALVGVITTPTLAQQGQWEQFFDFGPSFEDRIVAVHLVHVFDGTQGRVLAITYETNAAVNCPGSIYHQSDRVLLWTPPPIGSPPGFPGIFEAVPLCTTFLFCGGHTGLADGRVLYIGGQISLIDPPPCPPYCPPTMGSPDANLFDAAATAQWNTEHDMAQGRWYPTATTLADGRVLVCSGLDEDGEYVPIPELYDPSIPPPNDPWMKLEGAFTYYQSELYPYMFLLPDGNLVDAGPGTAYMLVSSSWTWAAPLPNPSWPDPPATPPGDAGSCVMYEPGKIMKCGGQVHPAVLGPTASPGNKWNTVLTPPDMEQGRWYPTAAVSYCNELGQ